MDTHFEMLYLPSQSKLNFNSTLESSGLELTMIIAYC